MKVFNLVMIAAIIEAVSVYDKLFLTSEGQMFVKKEDADEAVRTKNAIMDDPENLVSIVEISKVMFTPEVMARIGRNPKEFSDMFKENGRIPRSKVDENKPQFERKHDAPKQADAETKAAIEKALGGNVEAPKVEAPKVEAPKVEAPKVEAPKVEATATSGTAGLAPADAIKAKLGLK